MTQLTTAAPSYYGNHLGIRLLRFSFVAMQRMWPKLAVKTAHRLFCTPHPLQWRRTRASPPEGWQVESLPFENTHLTLYMPGQAANGPVVLLLHGWGGHAGQLLALASALREHGQHPIILDMPAHGRSGGRRSTLPQFSRALSYVAARLAQRDLTPQVLVAHSLGANAAAHAVSRGLSIKRLVLLAPPASPGVYTRVFAAMFGLSEKTRAAMQASVESREGIVMSHFEPASVGTSIRVPTLVIHDKDDRINSLADGESFSQHIAGAQFHMTQGLGHVRLLKAPQICEQVAVFCAEA